MSIFKRRKIIDNPFITELKDENGDSWYHQIVVETQKEEIERLKNIIKELREYLENAFATGEGMYKGEILEILDKENKND